MYIGTSYVIVKVDATTSKARIIAGSTSTAGSAGDGSAAVNALLGESGEMAYTTIPSERLYYVDQTYDYVKQIDLQTNIITTVAGIYSNDSVSLGFYSKVKYFIY